MTALSGKAALVTGASRGIGRASAMVLAQRGAQVLVHYGQAAREAEAVVTEIRKNGGRADAIGADLGAPDGPHQLALKPQKVSNLYPSEMAMSGSDPRHSAPWPPPTYRPPSGEALTTRHPP